MPGNEGQNKVLGFLYGNKVGRGALSVLVKPFVSNLGGAVLSTRLSRLLISPFVRKNGIDMNEYEPVMYESYNDFFMRKIRRGAREIDTEKSHLISPSDSKVTVYKIGDNSRFLIKNRWYTMESLVKNKKVAEAYRGGTMVICRLTVDDYHHYAYIDDGYKSKNYHISGLYHTVNPVANDHFPIYAENQREYTILHSDNFGDVLMMEVGALMVGKIANRHGATLVKRGEEKGHFEFGGSTIIMCFRKNRVKIDKDIIENTKNGIETKVKMGEKIGERH